MWMKQEISWSGSWAKMKFTNHLGFQQPTSVQYSLLADKRTLVSWHWSVNTEESISYTFPLIRSIIPPWWYLQTFLFWEMFMLFIFDLLFFAKVCTESNVFRMFHDCDSAGSFRLILFKFVCLEIFYLYLGSRSYNMKKKEIALSCSRL